MPSNKCSTRNPNEAPESDMVSFRAGAFIKTLREEAEKAGHKVGPHARELVQRALANTDHIELKTEVEKLRTEVRKSRGDLATFAKIMLMHLTKASPEQAELWIRNHFSK